ncbi:Sporulation initiation phosphotransferase F [Hartmannibacter diazotrophicus]|uniref:Sporulation initiation phosphotransferase F n=1 Tax=Hartmannibacter diazotrophicus TaxID=1482074 RepID=A0A2C9D7D5_9HYPH|nr:response regulator [Hartmannibacter diazotrophicus]SON56089.1 Sporulation initiation phosphotransferase F [Hartmannibacter diazotrophicus]
MISKKLKSSCDLGSRLLNILVVDDDLIVRNAIRATLMLEGHEVKTASNGLEGLLLFDDHRFDLAILDIFMPEMEGIETLRHLRERTPNTKVLAISGAGRGLPSGYAGDDRPDYLNFAVALGATSALAKPFSASELIDAIDKCMDSGRGEGSLAPEGVHRQTA